MILQRGLSWGHVAVESDIPIRGKNQPLMLQM